MITYKQLKRKQTDHWEKILKHKSVILMADVDWGSKWDYYLDSIPAELNPLYKERREFDCNCCKGFLRQIGAAVIVDSGGKPDTIWNFSGGEYQPMLDAMHKLVLEAPIQGPLKNVKRQIGTDKNLAKKDNDVLTFDHWYLEVPPAVVIYNNESAGEYASGVGVFRRTLEEITDDAINVVLDLVASKTLVRGDSWKAQLNQVLKLKDEYLKVKAEWRKYWLYAKYAEVGSATAKIKSSSIGVLLTDISQGMDLDSAVSRYETVVAGPNYKRPKPIFTAAMLEAAKKELSELGLLQSLQHRHATTNDIAAKDMCFIDRSIKQKSAGDVFAEMLGDVEKVVNPRTFSGVERVTSDDFLTNVLPRASKVEVLFESRHTQQLMSLLAPEDATSPSITKWGNNFVWSYTGNVASADLKQRVKAAGGRVDGLLRFSHKWNHHPGKANQSLMDLHMFFPGWEGDKHHSKLTNNNNCHDHYPRTRRVGWNNRIDTISGSGQDVDYTARAPIGYVPVENITVPNGRKLPEGDYVFKIHNWDLRQTTTSGFYAEIEFGGQVYEFDHPEPLEHKEWITLAIVTFKDGEFRMKELLHPVSQSQINVWGLKTNTWHEVLAISNSPNYWDDNVGYRHLFFFMKGAVNNEEMNSFYNEFLPESLNKYRKFMEALGAKMSVPKSDSQLSGIGFNFDQRNDVVVRVTGATSRVMRVVF